MKWETPALIEINMSAEIGGYQSDFSDRDPRDPIVQRDGVQAINGEAAGARFEITLDLPARGLLCHERSLR